MTNRISANGTGYEPLPNTVAHANGELRSEPVQPIKAKPARKRKPAAAPVAASAAPVKGKASPAERRKVQAARKVVVWAERYVTTAIVLSSALNAYTSVYHVEGTWQQVAAGLLGAVIPLLVWGAAKLAGWLERSGRRKLAVIVGAIDVGVLALSVVHVSEAISLLTGQHWLMSALLAVGIDCELVAAEYAAIAVAVEQE